jgi:parallel beta-helix repeat protein
MNRTFYPSVLLTLTLAACGGGGGSDGIGSKGGVSISESTTTTSSQTSVSTTTDTSTTPASTSNHSLVASTVEIEATIPSPAATSVQPIPTNIADGSTVSLQCGQTYQGTLDLNGKSNITVRTEGTCGKASITPGQAISGWTHYQGNIYSAPIGFHPVQVAVSGQPADAAHWPNRPQMWETNPGAVPNSDLDGATLVFLENQSVVNTQRISGNRVDTPHWFYVEGKLWMLDSPGEWAVSNGRLFMWAPDGQSPEGRTWAAPNHNGINASNSSNITIDGVRIFSAYDGINADTSANLRVLNTDIINSARDGIWASGSRGLVFDKSTLTNTVRSGIDGWYWIEGAVITNSTITNTGTVGRHKPTDAGIMFGNGADNRIDNVRVINSGYHGISVLHNWRTSVTNSVVDTACVQLTDCGGIYTGARDQLPLNLRIEGNTVSNVKGHEGIAIYLDDFANGVTVTGNTVSHSGQGMMIHNGFDNVVIHNTFESNDGMHLKFTQDSGNIRNNQVTNNTFKSTNNEWTFNMETGSNLLSFATFDYNTYISTNPNEFGRSWDGSSGGVTNSYADWKSWMGQDVNSTMNGAQ